MEGSRVRVESYTMSPYSEAGEDDDGRIPGLSR